MTQSGRLLLTWLGDHHMRSCTIILLFFLVSCTVSSTDLKGEILYGGQGIYLISLDGERREIVYDRGEISVDHVIRIDDDRYFVGYLWLKPGANRSRIAIYDRRDDGLTILAHGWNPTYVKGSDSLAYYGKGGNLIVRCLADTCDFVPRVIDISRALFRLPVVVVSDSQFVFESKKDGRFGIWLYDIENDQSRRLDTLSDCSLNKALWVEQSQELLCSSRSPQGVLLGEMFWTRLDGGNRRPADFIEDRDWPVAYVPELTSIVVQRRQFSTAERREIHPVFLYNLQTGTRTQLVEDAMLSEGVAVTFK